MAACNRDWFESISAWHDGEVSLADRERIEAHLAACADCRMVASALAGVGDTLRRHEQVAVPAALDQRVRALGRPRSNRRRRTAFAAGLAFAAAAAVGVASFPRPALGRGMTEEIVSHHHRGFSRERPCDFESNDPGKVAGWVRERLGYAVEVPTPPDATLLGARVCSVGGVKTAALMYRRAGAPLTIFVPPSDSRPAAEVAKFAAGEVRCTSGALSTAICATSTTVQPMLVVGDEGVATVASSLDVR